MAWIDGHVTSQIFPIDEGGLRLLDRNQVEAAFQRLSMGLPGRFEDRP